MKKILSIAVSFMLIVALLAGCGTNNQSKSSNKSNSNSSSTSTNNNNKQKTIEVIVKSTMFEYWQAVKLGAEDAGKKYGVNIVFQGPATETDIAGQINLVEDAINKKVDGIVLAASDPNSLAPYVDKAVDAGIPVVGIDSAVNSQKLSSFVATNNEAAAALDADELAKLIGGKGKVAIVNFVAGAGTAIAREKGFKDEIAKKYPNIQIVATQYSDGDQAKALSITEDLMTAHPDLAGIFGANEGSAVGVARAVEQKGMSGKIKVVGFDSSDNEINAIKNGSMQALVVQNPYKMGYLGVETVLKVLNGETVDKQIDTGATLVTKDNMNDPDIQKLLYPLGKK
ncbi:ABC transporter substrate-binding protein [Thermoanaerobacterium thermosaccharolyticum]|uniref:ABC transporter substrate-binding protein n=1 Tax=Thermoanaerobacterium thermosaccharolyticum TaxID=1517 RepID=UPI0020A349CF|nr:ABC transporter substrate-binding protein [Thermoanaerobacterium thermosaccharolyticum]MCP2240325.1 ribose transport system substrate-binding protein [Thermoanaerobacterium thermosaccharolyticum]